MENWYINPIDGEVSLEELQEKADNGEFHEWNFEPFEYQENGYEDVVEELRKYKAVDYIALDEKRKRAEEEGNTVEALGYKQQMDKMVEDVLKIYRSKNIFPIQYFSELGVMDEIEKCIAYKAKFDGNTVSCVSGDTEYFNGEEWKPIKDYTEGEKVLQYNVDGTAELVKPLRYIHKKDTEYFYVNRYDEDITSGYEIPMKITGDHRVPYFHNGVLMIEPLKVVLAKAETGMIEMDSLIPRGCIYGGTVKVDRSVLDEAYSAVMYQEFVSNNDLITIVNDSVCFSDECCRLELEDRKYLLGLLGIEPEDADIELENDFFGIDIIKSINNFLSLTYRDMCLWRPTECEYTVVSKCDTMYFDEGEYDKIYEANKYCFSVPSTLLVLRRNGIVFITGNCGAGVGTGLCRWLFPNLFDTPSAHDLTKKDAETQYKKFLNDEYLKRAIKFCYSYKDGCPVPTSVEGGLRLVGSAPSNFRPMNAKAVYERFCPKGGTIYDFCSGFGGRMLGALSSKNNYRYVGTDPCTETMYHLHQLGEYIEMVTGREDSYELHCCGSEDFRGKPNSIDFAFSSPPYFNLEVYSDESTQCYNKFPKLEEWLEGYVRQTIKNIYNMLKPGCFYAVNIADFKVGNGGEVAYVDEWKHISAEEGMPLFDTVYLGVTARAGSAEQAAGELKKENIMVFKKPL